MKEDKTITNFGLGFGMASDKPIKTNKINVGFFIALFWCQNTTQ